MNPYLTDLLLAVFALFLVFAVAVAMLPPVP
jgi:hypothetical protein